MNTPFPIFRFGQYALGNMVAAVGFLCVWTVLLCLKSVLILLLAFCFPVLVLIGFAYLWKLSGWKQVFPGAFSWLVVWYFTCALAVHLLLVIWGSP